MTSQTVPSSLRDLVADTLEISPDEVTPALSSESVDSWDSFRHLQLMLAIEGEYGVQFDPAQIPDLTSVRQLQAAIEAKGIEIH